MRRAINIIVMLCTIAVLCCGCSKQQLPMPIYPLDMTTVETALAEVELPWTIINEEAWGEGRILYELCNEENKGIAFISSAEDDNTRALQLSFFSSTELYASLPVEDWDKVVRLATIFYGGFENEGQVYDVFQKTYNELALVDEVPNAVPKDQERIRWKNEVNNINCFIGLCRKDIDSDSPTTELVTIYFSDLDESGSNNKSKNQ